MDRNAFASLFSQQTNNKNKTRGGRSSSSSSGGGGGGKSPRGRRASSSASKRAGHKRPRSADEGSRFVKCPLCGRSIHCSLAEVHVEQCAERADNTGHSLPTPSQAAGNAAPSCSRQHKQSSPSPSAVAMCGMNPDRRKPSPRGARGVALAAAANAAAAGTGGTAARSGSASPFAVEVSRPKGLPTAVVAAAGATELGCESPSMGKSLPTATGVITAEREAELAAETTVATVAAAATTTAAAPATPAPTADEGSISCPHASPANAADAVSQRELGRKKINPRGDQDSRTAPTIVASRRRAAYTNNATQTTKTTNTAASKVTAPIPPPNNAFSKLMAASALTNFREEMYLWGHQDGTLSWGWGAAGAPLPRPLPPPPSLVDADTTTRSSEGGKSGASAANLNLRSWSCQVATKGPEGRKAGMCEVWTNLPSVGLGGRARGAAERASVGGPGSGAGEGGGRGGGGAAASTGRDENVGLKAVHPGRSLSRLSVAVVKSMLQKNVRRGRAEAAARCALELGLKSWSDAIRRVLVIIVEDSLLHPAAPFLTWLMVATSKGYRPPPILLDAFLRVVYETAACPVRDTTDSCFLFLRPQRCRGRGGRGSGSGSGNGSGNCRGNGNGKGYRDGNGSGNSNNSSNSNGGSNGFSSGNGFNNGNGYGTGNGNDGDSDKGTGKGNTHVTGNGIDNRSGSDCCNGYGAGGGYNEGDSLPASFEADEFATPHPKDLMLRPGQRKARRSCTSSSGGAGVSTEHRPLSSATLPGRKKGGGGGELEDGSGARGGTEVFSRNDPSQKERRRGEQGPGIFVESCDGATAAKTVAAAAAAAAIDAPSDSSASTDDAAAIEGAVADEADAAIACCRRSLLMRASYGGMPFDQALLKGACLAWGERSGHCTPSPARASDRAAFFGCCSRRGGDGGGGGGGGGRAGVGNDADKGKLPPIPPPPPPICKATGSAFGGASPFGYVRGEMLSSWEGGGWTGFLAAAHAGTGMPDALRWRLMTHVVGGDGGMGTVGGAKQAPGSERLGEGGVGRGRARAGSRELGADEAVAVAGAVGAEVALNVAAVGALAAAAPVAPGTKNAAMAAAAVAERQRGPILREEDAILSGVDFHCSSVLDDLLRSAELAARVGKALHATTAATARAIAAAAHGSGGGTRGPRKNGEKQESVERTAVSVEMVDTSVNDGSSRRFGDPEVGVKQAAKQAMWSCSSGLNVRKLQVAFSPGGGGVDCERTQAYLKVSQTEATAEGGVGLGAGVGAEGVEGGVLCEGADVSEMDARVWAALSPDVLDWTRRFVRARLAPGAMKSNP